MAKDISTAPKARNSAVDFWRVLCTIGIAMFHYTGSGFAWGNNTWMADLFTGAEGSSPPFFYGGTLLGFFLLTTGFFMVASYKSKQKKGLTNIPASTQAWIYVGSRFKSFYPVVLLGYLFGTISKCIYSRLSPRQWLYAIILNSWELTGLSQLGAMTTNTNGVLETLDARNCLKLAADTQFLTPWNLNGPIWYLSAILIISVILYYLLAADEGRFKCVWLPLFTIVFCGHWGYWTPGMMFDRAQVLSIGIPTNIMWCLGGLSMGALLYYLYDFIRQKELTKFAKGFITVLNAIATVFLLVVPATNFLAWMDPTAPGTISEMVWYPSFAIVIICNSMNKDVVSQVMNKWSVFGKLGSFSLYWFACHYVMMFIIHDVLVPGPLAGLSNNFWAVTVIYLALTTVAGLVMQFLCKRFLEPLIGKFVTPGKKEAVAQ